MSEQKKLSWSTGPDEVNIGFNGETIEIDFRISHGVAKNRYPVVFKTAGLDKPEPETGEVVKTHKIGETDIFVTYRKE